MTEYLDNYHLNVLTPLKNLREINKSQGNKLFIEITKNKAIYQDSKNADIQKMKYEQSKFNQNTSAEQKNKLLKNSEISISEAKDSEINYINQITYTNIARESYISNYQRILSDFQALQLAYHNKLKEIFLKLNDYSIIYVNNVKSDLDSSNKVIYHLF